MTPLAGHTGSYYSYAFEDALVGLAEAGYRGVELSAVPGATEHVDVHGDPADVRARLGHYGLEAVSISGHSDLTTREGLEHGLAVVSWAERFGLPVVNTAIGGHAPDVDESEEAFLRNIGPLADAAQAAGLTIALEIHG
jgi:sugar phosphate isomerase/epimerase